MASTRRISHLRGGGNTLLPSLLPLSLAAGQASAAYPKPAGGRWRFLNLFDDTKSGALVLSRDSSKVVKLVLKPGDTAAACGAAAIRLKSRPKVRSYRGVNGRYAVGRIRRGLFVPTPMTFKQGRRAFRAKLLLLWDDARQMNTGRFEHGDCTINFFAHKR
jgi:hypothetical protein